MSHEPKPARTRNRTNVRALTLPLLGPLGRVAPRFASELAMRAFFTPPETAPSVRTLEFLAGGQRTELPLQVPSLSALGPRQTGDGRVATWRWGRSGRVVLLVHGWGGVGGQLSAFARPLLERGYSVVAFDAPAHGQSPGTMSSLIHFSLAIRAVAAHHGPLHGVVAHSLGGAAVTHALAHGLETERVVFVGVPADVRLFFERFLTFARFSAPLRERFMREVAARIGFRWEELVVTEAARTIAPPPLLLVHDFGDAEVPFADGAAIASAWSGARVLATTGLGHRKVLRDENVVRRAVEFLLDVPTSNRGEWEAAAGR